MVFRQNAYFPYRAVKDRPYIDEFMRLADGERTWDVLAQLALFRTMGSFGTREQTRGNTVATACGMNEAKLCDPLAHFFNQGHVVFHIAQPLRDAFLTSDLGDATAEDLKFPFDAFYVHLGTDMGVIFNDGAARLEGALLQRHPDGAVIVCLVGGLLEEPEHWGFRGFESFNFFIDKEQLQRPLLDAIRERLAKEARDPNELRELNDWEGFTPEQKESIQSTWATHAKERELHLKNLAVTLDAMKLVANALLYLSQYPEDAEPAWQEGTPKSYIEKYTRQDGKARAKTLSRSQHEGFTIIRKVGKLFEREQAKEQGESPSPHLRRAHWRRQAYGPKLSFRRLVWIRAVRVLGGAHRERAYLLVDKPVDEAQS